MKNIQQKIASLRIGKHRIVKKNQASHTPTYSCILFPSQQQRHYSAIVPTPNQFTCNEINLYSILINIARIANAVHCHSWLSRNKNCHEFKFSIVRIVISVLNVASLQDCLKSCQNFQNSTKFHELGCHRGWVIFWFGLVGVGSMRPLIPLQNGE